MEEDDNKHLYEVEKEMQEYESEIKDDFPHRPIANLQIHDTVPTGGKCSLYVLLAIQLVIILILIILLGINGVTLTHLNTVEVCDNTGGGSTTGASTGSLTSGSDVKTQIGQLLNVTRETSKKVDGIVNYTTTDRSASKNQSDMLASLKQNSQNMTNQLGKVVKQAQDTSTKIDDLQSFATQQTTDTQNISATIDQVLQKAGDSAQKLTTIVGALNNIKKTGQSTSSVANDILGIVNELLELQNASSIFNSIRPVSCKDIKAVQPNSATGYYHVNSRTIYCNMDTLCNSTEGWTRLGYLDMTDATQSCPSGFRLYQSGSVRACGRMGTSASCSPSISLPTNGISYTQICGRVKGYQKGSTDAIAPNSQHNNINSYYLDGVSITRGTPREHVWSFISGVFSTRVHNSNCPCNTNAFQANYVQSFIGDNYYCESGNPNTWWSNSVYTSDPLWDGQQCLSYEAPCCTNPNLPWFFRDYKNVSSTEGLEMRLCGDEGWQNEDNPISQYEIYVK